MIVRLAVVATLLGCAVAPATQGRDGEPIRLGLTLDEAPRVGQLAPDLVLPYVTRDRVGPAGQPFELRKELGLVVVMSFCRLDTAVECLTQWRTFRDQQSTMFGAGVVVVGVSVDSLRPLAQFAAGQELPFKLVSDPDRVYARRFGFIDGTGRIRHTVMVIGRDGKIRYIDSGFSALESPSYNNLAGAVKAAKES
ncbi:MAG: redoxin domain-containing protein [Gemmatimonadales bacterium]